MLTSKETLTSNVESPYNISEKCDEQRDRDFTSTLKSNAEFRNTLRGSSKLKNLVRQLVPAAIFTRVPMRAAAPVECSLV